MNLRRVVLDVDKAVAKPSLIEIAEAMRFKAPFKIIAQLYDSKFRSSAFLL